MNSVQFSTATATDMHQFNDTLVEHAVVAHNFYYRQSDGRTCRPDATLTSLTPAFGRKVSDVIFNNGHHVVTYRQENALIQLAMTPQTRSLAIDVAAASAEERNRLIRELREMFPAREIPPDREEVMVAFWSLTPNGARAMERSITIAPWDRVKSNYTPQTQSGLSHLMNDFKPTRAGQLLLWYGPPGTGKTHALRALTWEWRKWSTFHYITDPEIFFGGNANYMLDVLLMRGGNEVDIYDDDGNRTQKPGKWRLLILEDSGELMVPDAKAQTGQGLSRLLNVVDGLIGQGLKIMVLVTTNEILKKLHPAVARPGRCAARIEFGEFKKEEAGLWLANNGRDAATNEFGLNTTVSLAELYSAIGDEQTISESKSLPVGFGS